MNKVHTTTHSGKLDGMHSISTSGMHNINCESHRKVKGSICEKCYALTYEKMRKGLREKLAQNTKLLTETCIPEWDLPIINDSIFRFESFGDLNNVTQVENYFNIAKKNRRTTLHYGLRILGS